VGQIARPIRLRYLGRVDLIGVRIAAASSRRLIDVPPASYANRVTALHVVAPELDRALIVVYAGDSVDARSALLAATIGAAISIRPSADRQLIRAVELMRKRGGNAPVSAVARSLGINQRRLERHFRRDVGLSPKRLSRILRLQAALAPADPSRGLTELATTLGYADQAHFSRDFRELTGIIPSRAWWLRAPAR
jgi:transcriptional regulator GlxA family with amidase domain